MLKIRYSNQFKKDYKKIQKRGYDVNKLKYVIQLLAKEKPLPDKYKEHEIILTVSRTGSHSDLF